MNNTWRVTFLARASVFYLLGDVVQLQASSFAYHFLQNIMQGLMDYDAFDLILMHFAKDVYDSIACVEKPLNWWKLEDEFQRASHHCSPPFDVEPRVLSSEQTCVDFTINTIFRFQKYVRLCFAQAKPSEREKRANFYLTYIFSRNQICRGIPIILGVFSEFLQGFLSRQGPLTNTLSVFRMDNRRNGHRS